MDTISHPGITYNCELGTYGQSGGMLTLFQKAYIQGCLMQDPQTRRHRVGKPCIDIETEDPSTKAYSHHKVSGFRHNASSDGSY